MLIERIKPIVLEASQLMVHSGFDVKQKGDATNLVTSSDLAVQHFLVKRLAEILPGSGFLCEEEDLGDIRHEYVWIIDPIDGTANYARGIDHCCISVALARDGMLVYKTSLERFDLIFWVAAAIPAYFAAFLLPRRRHPHDRVIPRFMFEPRPTNSSPQSQRTSHMALPFSFLPAKERTESLENLLPVRSM